MAQKVRYQIGDIYDNHQGIIDISVEPSPKFIRVCLTHTHRISSQIYKVLSILTIIVAKM